MRYIANYHTHHPFCRHAIGSIEAYVKEAIKANLKELGFSDHAPSNLFDDGLRMSYPELDLYLNEIAQAKIKHGDHLEIRKGLEAEYLELDDNYYRSLLRKVDYLILGQHYIGRKQQKFKSTYALKTKNEILTYKEEVIEAMQSGYFKIFAHPDLYLYAYPHFDETAYHVAQEIIEAAIKNNVVLEYNANGIRKGTKIFPEGERYYYPRKEFWESLKHYPNAQVIVSADAHRPSEILDEAIKIAFENLANLKITPLERINFNTPKFSF